MKIIGNDYKTAFTYQLWRSHQRIEAFYSSLYATGLLARVAYNVKMAWLTRLFDSMKRPYTHRSATLAPLHETRSPSLQNAIDLFSDWTQAFPPDMNLTAGQVHLHHDPRILWAVEQWGSLTGKHILELGPLEGSHTALLERLGAARIDAIEANKSAFLRCLVAKEAYGLVHSHFWLGDFVSGLAAPQRYDLIIACGVLYHMANPLLLLERMAARTNTIYLWTHYFDEEELPKGDHRRRAFEEPAPPHAEHVETVSFHGVNVNLHLRSYYQAWKEKTYCGGPKDTHYWLEKRQIMACLQALGFDNLTCAHETPDHPNGPAMSILAQRRMWV